MARDSHIDYNYMTDADEASVINAVDDCIAREEARRAGYDADATFGDYATADDADRWI